MRLWSKFGRPIEPFYPDVAGAGRPPNGFALVLRMYVLQQSFGLSDGDIEDTVDNSQAIGASVGIYLGRGGGAARHRLESTARALAFIGVVPKLIVPDNPTAMIADPNRYEPRSDATPCPTSRATTAPRFCARLRTHQFHCVHEVSQAVAPLLTRRNEKAKKPLQNLPGSRAGTFAGIDAPALLPLPLQRYELAQSKTIKVHIDYPVEVEGRRYSFPPSLVG